MQMRENCTLLQVVVDYDDTPKLTTTAQCDVSAMKHFYWKLAMYPNIYYVFFWSCFFGLVMDGVSSACSFKNLLFFLSFDLILVIILAALFCTRCILIA